MSFSPFTFIEALKSQYSSTTVNARMGSFLLQTLCSSQTLAKFYYESQLFCFQLFAVTPSNLWVIKDNFSLILERKATLCVGLGNVQITRLRQFCVLIEYGCEWERI